MHHTYTCQFFDVSNRISQGFVNNYNNVNDHLKKNGTICNNLMSQILRVLIW